jgi:N6-adenosine-specific RNA methylase IME4
MPKLNEVFKVIDAWGFEYKTCGFVWVKRNKVFSDERNKNRNGIDDFMGQGRWVLQNAELCLIATKGNITRIDASISQIIDEKISEHSEKPKVVRELITQLVGKLPRIELFSRNEEQDGWYNWGNNI